MIGINKDFPESAFLYDACDFRVSSRLEATVHFTDATQNVYYCPHIRGLIIILSAS